MKEMKPGVETRPGATYKNNNNYTRGMTLHVVAVESFRFCAVAY